MIVQPTLPINLIHKAILGSAVQRNRPHGKNHSHKRDREGIRKNRVWEKSSQPLELILKNEIRSVQMCGCIKPLCFFYLLSSRSTSKQPTYLTTFHQHLLLFTSFPSSHSNFFLKHLKWRRGGPNLCLPINQPNPPITTTITKPLCYCYCCFFFPFNYVHKAQTRSKVYAQHELTNLLYQICLSCFLL